LQFKLPAGYVDYDKGAVRVVASRLELEEMVTLLTGPARDEEPLRAGTEPDQLTPIPPAGAQAIGGRGGTRRIVLAGGKAVFLRKYLRGGLPRYFVRDLFLLRPERPLRELIVTEAARAAGCAVPLVLAVCIEEAGLFHRGWIVTEAIDGAVPLIDAYFGAEPGLRGSLLRSAGEAFRSLHRAGVYHVDLTGYNVLVRPGGALVVIDFDRGFLARPDIPRLAEKGLDRFWRSMTKLCAARGLALATDEKRWLQRGYRA